MSQIPVLNQSTIGQHVRPDIVLSKDFGVAVSTIRDEEKQQTVV